jgi:predicted flap endonuclease-1-like 5' DNA nuclease
VNKRPTKKNLAKKRVSSKSNCPLTARPQMRRAADAAVASMKDQFPRGVARPALRALHAAGFTHLDQLAAISERELAQLHGMGPTAVAAIRAALHAKGLSFLAPHLKNNSKDTTKDARKGS